jgi:hypothetical protein
MLPTHGRYRHSSIVSRPDYTWPGGKRLAVYVAVNVEAFGWGIGKGAAPARAVRRPRGAGRGADEHRGLRAVPGDDRAARGHAVPGSEDRA